MSSRIHLLKRAIQTWFHTYTFSKVPYEHVITHTPSQRCHTNMCSRIHLFKGAITCLHTYTFSNVPYKHVFIHTLSQRCHTNMSSWIQFLKGAIRTCLHAYTFSKVP